MSGALVLFGFSLSISLQMVPLLPGSFHVSWASYSVAVSGWSDFLHSSFLLPEWSFQEAERNCKASYDLAAVVPELLSSHSIGQANHSGWPKRRFKQRGEIDSTFQWGNDMGRQGGKKLVVANLETSYHSRKNILFEKAMRQYNSAPFFCGQIIVI